MKNSAIIVAVLAILLTGCGREKEAPQKVARFVKTEKVSYNSDLKEHIFNGTIKEKSDVTLSFRVGGPVNALNVEVGDYVQQGEVIATIDKRDYKIQLQSTTAQYEQLKGEYARYKELYKKGKIPANSYEKIESGYLMAKVGYENAVNQLNDTELKAPFSGYVYKKFISSHETTGPGHPVISLIDVSKLEVIVNVPASQLKNIENCSENYVEVKNAGIYNKPVRLLSVNEKTGDDQLYEVRFSLNNSSQSTLRSGMSAKVTLLCNEKSTAPVTVPVEAVFHLGGKNLVWIFNTNDSIVKSREVTIGTLREGGRVEVLSGLSVDEVIVTAGVNTLIEEQLVKPLLQKSKTNIGGIL